jgi:hypothetical protein
LRHEKLRLVSDVAEAACPPEACQHPQRLACPPLATEVVEVALTRHQVTLLSYYVLIQLAKQWYIRKFAIWL